MTFDYEDISVRQRLRGTTCSEHPDHVLALVGEAPGPRTRSDLPFYPYPPASAAGRLRTILGWTRSEYLLTFARCNLLDEWPGPRFPVAKARGCVPEIVERMQPRPILLMGRGVAQAFDVGDLAPCVLTTRVVAGWAVHLAVVPHTSGRNLWYNERANQLLVRDFINNLAGRERSARARHGGAPNRVPTARPVVYA